MPIDVAQGGQLPGNEPTPPQSETGWWGKLIQGFSNANVSFTSGPNGWTFGSTGGGDNKLPTPPSTQDINAWLPYVIGGAVLLKLLK
jgi:hypothetical protein